MNNLLTDMDIVVSPCLKDDLAQCAIHTSTRVDVSCWSADCGEEESTTIYIGYNDSKPCNIFCTKQRRLTDIVREPAVGLIMWLRPKGLKMCSFVEMYAEFKNQTLIKIR